MKTFALFQARMGSSRLPGKVLRDLVGRPLLWHVLNRVRRSKRLDQIIVATTGSESDLPLRGFLEKENIPIFLGSENDVLDRFYQAAREFKATVIVRITPDDPFKDPEVIDRAIQIFQESKPPVDYVSNCSYDGSIKATYPEGLDIEVLSFDCLERLWQRAKLPSEREHLTPYLFTHANEFKIKGFYHTEDLSHLRWTIDYENDFRFAGEIYKRLYPKKEIFLMNDILEVLKKEPHISEINQGTVRYEGYLRSVSKEVRK